MNMNRKKIVMSIILSVLLCPLSSWGANLTQYVNPYIGTGGHGHVFLGANVPFGLVQLGPQQPKQGWDWCSGYHYSDSKLYGIGHMHLSGTGIGELGDVSFLPVCCEKQKLTHFRHENEQVRPGYYSVYLHESGIRVELTATKRCGMHRYQYPATMKEARLLLNLNQGIGWDELSKCGMQQESKTLITGFRRSTGWAKDQHCYFAAEFSRPVTMQFTEGDSIALVSAANTGEPLLVRVGISAVSIDGAKKNLQAEINHWDFNRVVRDAEAAWEQELGKVVIDTTDKTARTIFYTALYHTMTAPSVFCDVDGQYRGSDGKVYQGQFTNYTTFSLWDTYRAAHPLMTLIHPEKQHDMAETFMHIYQQQGKLPIWHLMGNETDCMVGNPGNIVLADLAMKGYVDDIGAALEAMKQTDLKQERGLDLREQYGYIPTDKDPTFETVAKDLEYAIADGAAAALAKKVGKKDFLKFFQQRSQIYRKHWDAKTRFMRGVTSEGKFREPFDPFNAIHRQDDYTEGNAWQYLWLVPHDVHGLVSLFGSEQQFAQKLDSLFIVTGNLGAEASPDISGLIGQYAHGNEPSHHIIYMYNYIGQPWKAAKLLRQVYGELYKADFDGLSGNEDVGQMSAWYVLSAMGFYQVEPAGGKYIIGSPLFDSVELKVKDGKTFRVVACDNSADNIYIQRATLNGKPYTRSYINYSDITAGGTLELQMGPKPSAWGTAKKDRP